MTQPTQTTALADNRYVVLPFYLLCDVSGSMTPHIGALNESLLQFRDELARNPVLSDKVQFGVVDFADDAGDVIPLGDFSSADLNHRQLTARGGTNYGAAFRTMRATIERDMAAGAERFRYFRPAVFFLTDGAPTDSEWPQAFADLTSLEFTAYPLFVPFGIGDADATVLSGLVHPQNRSTLFMANAGTSPATAITKMTEAMLKSVLNSGRSAMAGTPQHVVPTQADVGPGVTAYPGGNFVT